MLMSAFRFLVTQDNKIAAAEGDVELGLSADGSSIHEVYNCPPEAQIEDAAYLMTKGPIKEGMFRHNFADLASGGASCCGACS